MAQGYRLLAVGYVFLVTGTRMKRFDWRLVDAARDPGADGWQVFGHVLLPHLWPGIAGGALLSLAVSLEEYVIASFLSGLGAATVPVAGPDPADLHAGGECPGDAAARRSVPLALAALLLWRKGAR